MKRLLEDTPDELSRSLLEAGSVVQPRAAGKQKLFAAIAAGGASGVASFSSGAPNAGAVGVGEPGTGVAGTAKTVSFLKLAKMGLVLAVVGVGSALVATQSRSAAPSSAVIPTGASVPAVEREVRESSASASNQAPSEPSAEAPELRAHSSRSVNNTHPRRRVAVLGEHAVQADTEGSRQAPIASKELDGEKDAPLRLIPEQASELVREARLVQSLRQAIQSGDMTLAEALSAQYWEQFPRGQLKPEVSALDNRLNVLRGSHGR